MGDTVYACHRALGGGCSWICAPGGGPVALDPHAANVAGMTRHVLDRGLPFGRGSLAIVPAVLFLAGCGASEPPNGTLRCGLSEPRCPSGSVCVPATDTCWRIGTYDGGGDGGASLWDGASLEASAPVDGPTSDVPLPPLDGSFMDAGGIDSFATLDASLDEAHTPVDASRPDAPRPTDGAKDVSDARPVLDSTTDTLNSLSCSELSSEYNVALAKAKICTVGSKAPCGQTVKSGIYCGCSVPVNAAQTAALATMDALRKAWTDKGCTTVCPAIACVVYKGAVCSADASTSGTCVGTL